MAHRSDAAILIKPGELAGLSPGNNGNQIDISYFVPCYNEEPNVEGALGKIMQVSEMFGLSYEILVFDDCSKDDTVGVVSRFIASNPTAPIRLYTNEKNQGVARNFVEGAFRAHGRFYRLICGDDVEPIESHTKLLDHLGDADIIIPYFTVIGGRRWHRHAISRTYTWLVNVISKNRLRYYNGCPIYRTGDVLRFHVEATGFGYQAEFLTRLLHEGRGYIEVPLESIDREGGGSVNLRNFVSVGHSLLKMGLRRTRTYFFK